MILYLLLTIMAVASIIGIIIAKIPTKELNIIYCTILLCSAIILGCTIGLIIYLNNRGVLLI